MANTWGSALRLSIFGESHGEGVGIVVDGLPAGESIDEEKIAREMARRAPGKSAAATGRQESDTVEILSGFHEGKTTGAPLCGFIRNKNARPGDYDSKLRPGHADMTALQKYGGHADMRGGGHFSGRLTAPLVFAGAVAGQLLARRGIVARGRIASIAEIADGPAPSSEEAWRALAGREFLAFDERAASAMKEAVLAAGAVGDSLGGVVEAVAFGVPPGLGEPFFHSLESSVASLLFSIPAVKGVEFGDGFALAQMRGSQANDPIFAEEGRLRTATNHNGGILGGISNGMPIIARAAIKPTPSIALPQRTVEGESLKEAALEIRGRHDPCIIPRAVPVARAALLLALLEALLREKGSSL